MAYLQARGCVLVAASPEILTRVSPQGKVTNRPLAGTRKRGRSREEDEMLEEELRQDEKECSEHVMLVDLSRNDVGKVAKFGSVKVEKLMTIERYSHVMHLSSMVTGQLKDGFTPWDVLRAALPVGTVTGAPKVRAMQLIDKPERRRRGPYGGGLGCIGFRRGMDVALTLRTMVFQLSTCTKPAAPAAFSFHGCGGSGSRRYAAEEDTQRRINPCWRPIRHRREWVVHLQAGAGIVADSIPENEHQECINKAAALERAIDIAETAFLH